MQLQLLYMKKNAQTKPDISNTIWHTVAPLLYAKEEQQVLL